MHAVISANQVVNDQTAVRQSNTFIGKIFPLIFDWINTLQSTQLNP